MIQLIHIIDLKVENNKKNIPKHYHFYYNNHSPKPPLPPKHSQTKQTPIYLNLRQKPPPTISKTKL